MWEVCDVPFGETMCVKLGKLNSGMSYSVSHEFNVTESTIRIECGAFKQKYTKQGYILTS